MSRAADRSFEKITKRDLRKLSEIAAADREDLFRRLPHLRQYRRRVVCVVLCQGAALHYVDGQTGIKDIDVWTFFAARGKEFPPRRVKAADFGHPKFARHPDDPTRFVGRRVDLLGRSLPVPLNVDPMEMIRDYLSKPRTDSAKKLARKAVVIIDPPELRGRVVWNPDR